jgi:peptide subunit release factor 1 (eRF1)
MSVIPSTKLQTLASVKAEDATALSVYLDLDPSLSPTPGDISGRVRAMIDRLREERPDRGSDAMQRFDEGVEQIEQFLAGQDLRGEREVHGAALFAHGQKTFQALPLWRSAGEAVLAGRRFALRRLASADSRTSELLLVIAGRELGRVVLLRDGRLAELVDADEEVENRHSQGGWAQSKLQRYTDRAAELHLANVVEIAERVHSRLDRPPIVIAATGENAAVVRERLGQEATAALAGDLPNVRDFDEAALLKALTELADAHDRERERRLLEQHAAQVGRQEVGDSLEAALTAISDARVETLLVAPGADPEVCSCPQCGRLSDHAQVCPLDGSFIQVDPEGLELAVAETIERGGRIWQLADDNRDALPGHGVGVITRY